MSQEQELASSDPAADQQARTDAAADAGTEGAANGPTDADTLREAAGPQAQVTELTAALGEANATIASLTADKDDLVAQVQARVPGAVQHDEERLHNLWTQAGGKLSEFEAAKRFVASL